MSAQSRDRWQVVQLSAMSGRHKEAIYTALENGDTAQYSAAVFHCK